MAELIKIDCEYDYGQDDVVFTTEDKAKAWLRATILSVEGEDEDYDFDYLFNHNLIWIEKIALDPENSEE